MDSNPSAMRERVGCAQTRDARKNTATLRISRCYRRVAVWLSDDGVGHAIVAEFGAVAGAFAGGGEEASGERLAPLVGERGDVAEGAGEGGFGDVAAQGNGVESTGADGGVGEQG